MKKKAVRKLIREENEKLLKRIQEENRKAVEEAARAPWVQAIKETPPITETPPIMVTPYWDCCPMGGAHEYYNPWWGTTPPPCKKCGQGSVITYPITYKILPDTTYPTDKITVTGVSDHSSCLRIVGCH